MEVAMTRKSESGQALVLTALALVVLIGFAGLAIDMGALRYQKRLQQSAADAAAMAGASNLASTSGGVTAGAQNASATNGFTDTGGGQTSACTASGATVGTVCVQVNNPPLSGPHTSDAKYVEALVAVVQPTYFMKIFGVSSEAITARAVATNVSGGGPNSGCLYTLGPPSSAIEGVNINGSATLNATTCGIDDNGNFNTKGNALVVNTGTFGVSGDWDKSGQGGTVTCGPTQPTCPATNVPAATNPLLNQLTPPCNPCTVPTLNPQPTVINGITTYSPGTYSFISISSNPTIVFSPGVYIIDSSQGITITGTPTITGNGVTFYFTNGATISNTGTGVTNFTAPDTSGQYPGILFYQDPADTNGPTLGGNSGTTYNGVLYFSTSNVTFFGHNNSIATDVVIADALTLSGNPTVNLQGATGLPTGVSILTHAVLVE
jgi:Flp pilus assembly protein TadG